MKTKKYDTSLIDAEIKQMKKRLLFNTIKSIIYATGYLLALLVFATFMVYAVVMMMTEPSLTGNY